MKTLQVLGLSAVLLTASVKAGPLLDSLNGMALLMSGDPLYNPEFYPKLSQCLNSADPELLQLHDLLWAGALELAANADSKWDWTEEWRNCYELPENYTHEYFDFNCSTQVQPGGQMYIFEPCNYASNMAFYQLTVEICAELQNALEPEFYAAMVKASSYLGFGSSLFHASQTTVGHVFDATLNDLIVYLMYQEAVKSLAPLGSPIITDLSESYRTNTAIEVVDIYKTIFMTMPITEWEAAILQNSDIPSLTLVACGLLSTIAVLLFDVQKADGDTMASILGQTDLFEDSEIEFCLNKFLPEISNATANMVLDQTEIQLVQNTTVVIVVKFLYAALWQEYVLTHDPWLFTPEANELGTQWLPLVNDYANQFLAIVHSNQDFQHGVNVYPGESWCNPTIPHAKWHVEAALALFDIAYACKWLNELLGKGLV